MEGRLITFTTDFGDKDPFVGIMKGIVFGINPAAYIIDLSHGIPPQDVVAGALALRYAAPFFPHGTIHVAVVDPEVGSRRRPLLIEAEGNFFIGPDNGILSLALEGKEVRQTIELSNETYHLKPTSATFHGRDIFAPAAGYLSLGFPPEDFGRTVADFSRLRWPEVKRRDGGIEGEIIYIDGFGNLITNVREHDLTDLTSPSLLVSLGELKVHGLSSHYAGGAGEGYVVLINSWGLLEISYYRGDARLQSGAKIGDRIEVRTVNRGTNL